MKINPIVKIVLMIITSFLLPFIILAGMYAFGVLMTPIAGPGPTAVMTACITTPIILKYVE